MILKGDDEPVIEMEEEQPKFVSSICAISVHEMVKVNPSLVPLEYIRSHEEMEKEKIMAHLSPFIPVIDFAMLKNENTTELLKLDFACKEWGVFQLVNHSVKKELMQRIKDVSAEFFNLQIKEKRKYAMCKDMQGYGHIQVQPDDPKLDWSESLILVTHPSQHRNLSVWPKTPWGFKGIIEEYSSGVNQVGVELVNYLSKITKKPNELLEGITSFFDVNYYPPCSKSEQVLGMNRHIDMNTITLVMQDEDDASQLEFKHKGGWVPVTPISNALVVNVGHLIETWSKKRFKSIEHRVVTNESKVRIAHVTGLFPLKYVKVEP